MGLKTVDFHSVTRNIIAAFTTTIVALSLGAAFGMISGRGAFLGMVSAAVIAFVTSLLGGTKIKCSGPTAPMTVLVSAMIISTQEYSFPGITPDQFMNFVFLLTALVVFLFGVFKFGKFVSLVPNVVISGFMSGIGLIILIGQGSKVFHYQDNHDFNNFLIYVGIVLFTLLICYATPYFTKKHIPKWSGILSGTLLALILITVFVEWFSIDTPRIDLGTSSQVDPVNLLQNHLPGFSNISWKVLLFAFPLAIELAIAIYLDSLLTAMILDRMTKRKSRLNRELFSQSVGTAIVSFFGGIPGAQATERSVLLIKEGATMRIAGILVGIFSLVGIFVFQDSISLIPQAVFVGILLKVALDIFDFTPLRLYCHELLSDHVLRDFFSRHDDQPIFVTNREIIFILGTMILTLLTNFTISVFTFTVLYHVGNKWFWKNNPTRDLKPKVETRAVR